MKGTKGTKAKPDNSIKQVGGVSDAHLKTHPVFLRERIIQPKVDGAEGCIDNQIDNPLCNRNDTLVTKEAHLPLHIGHINHHCATGYKVC